MEGCLFVEESFDNGIIGCVPNVDDGLFDIGERSVSFFQEGFNVLESPPGLGKDKSGVYDIAFMVDTCSTGDVDMSAIAVSDGGAAFEGDTVFACAVEIMRGVEKLDLGFF